MSGQPIGVFDSGVGGLTVLKQLLTYLPGEQMIYLGDTARLPYGTKSKDTVVRYSLNNTRFLQEKGIKFLVVACNTASALAMAELRAQFSIPIVGVIEPGAARAAAQTAARRVGVIGTAATVRSRAYEQAIHRCREDISVFSESCPLFVPLAEEGWLEDDVTLSIAERYLQPLRSRSVDVLVLGCTHYPLLKPVVSRVMGPGVTLVDSAEEVARQVRDALAAESLAATDAAGDSGQGPSPQIYLTDCSSHFVALGEKILGFALTDVAHVDIG